MRKELRSDIESLRVHLVFWRGKEEICAEGGKCADGYEKSKAMARYIDLLQGQSRHRSGSRIYLRLGTPGLEGCEWWSGEKHPINIQRSRHP
jgi:hypothetical protein